MRRTADDVGVVTVRGTRAVKAASRSCDSPHHFWAEPKPELVTAVYQGGKVLITPQRGLWEQNRGGSSLAFHAACLPRRGRLPHLGYTSPHCLPMGSVLFSLTSFRSLCPPFLTLRFWTDVLKGPCWGFPGHDDAP